MWWMVRAHENINFANGVYGDMYVGYMPSVTEWFCILSLSSGDLHTVPSHQAF